MKIYHFTIKFWLKRSAKNWSRRNNFFSLNLPSNNFIYKLSKKFQRKLDSRAEGCTRKDEGSIEEVFLFRKRRPTERLAHSWGCQLGGSTVGLVTQVADNEGRPKGHYANKHRNERIEENYGSDWGLKKWHCFYENNWKSYHDLLQLKKGHLKP